MRILCSLALGAAILLWLLYRVDIRQLGVTLRGVHPEILGASLAILVGLMWIKSVRWAIAIRCATGRPVCHAFSASMIGFSGNLLLPARLGELARASVIDKHNRIGLSLALTTIGIIQLFDLLVLVAQFLIVTIWVASPFTAYRWTVGLVGGIACALLGGLVLAHRRSRDVRSWLLPLWRRLPATVERPLTRYGTLSLKGLSLLGQGHVLARILVLTLAVWSLEILAALLMLLAFDIRPSFLVAAMLVIALSLSFALPMTPGNVGIAQAVTVLLLGAHGVAPETALAYSLGSQGATHLLVIGLGMVCLHMEGLKLSLIWRGAHSGPATAPPAVGIQ